MPYARRLLYLLILVIMPVLSFAGNTTKKDCDSLILQGIYKMKTRRYVYALEDLSKARQIAAENKWYSQEFLALNNIGLTYYKMLDNGNAVTCFLNAYELALANKSPTDEMIILNNIALVYSREKKYEQAEEYFLKAFAIAKDEKISSRIGMYATNLAQLYLDKKDFISAEKFLRTAIPNLTEKPQVLINANILKSTLLLENGQAARAIADLGPLLQNAVKSGFIEETVEINLLLSKCYSALNQFGMAEDYARRALKMCTDKEVKIKIFSQLSVIALKIHDIGKMATAKDSVIMLTNMVNETMNRELLENSRLKFELAASQHALDINNTRLQNQRKLYLLIALLLIPTLLALIWAVRKKSIAAKQAKIIAEGNLKITELELENEKIQTTVLKNELKEKELLAQLEAERQKEYAASLSWEIEQKNKQLSDKILFQSTRNELIEEIIGRISQSPGFREKPDLVRIIHDLRIYLKEDSQWDEITSNFELVNTRFLNALRTMHPNLTANDIRFLSFVYLNLNNKEIANLLNISVEGCRKRKERITAKLKLDKETSLLAYLSHLQ
ncbi:MAG TPA: tetratricopeptide repeat protein [Bacteroidales bacterium]|nr:tetratricopeptide repeat protein [Bacteroidales bacterium]